MIASGGVIDNVRRALPLVVPKTYKSRSMPSPSTYPCLARGYTTFVIIISCPKVLYPVLFSASHFSLSRNRKVGLSPAVCTSIDLIRFNLFSITELLLLPMHTHLAKICSKLFVKFTAFRLHAHYFCFLLFEFYF